MAKGITPAARERLKATLETEVRPRFAHLGERWQSAAAKVIGVDQSTISRMLSNPPMGGSQEFVERVAKYVNVEPAMILFGKADPNRVPRLRELPGYARALDVAKQRISEEGRLIETWALEKAGDYAGTPVIKEVTSEVLIAFAASYMRDPDLVARHGSGTPKPTPAR